MGVIADKLAARLTDLIARSEETDRLVMQARVDVQAAIAEIDRVARDLEEESV